MQSQQLPRKKRKLRNKEHFYFLLGTDYTEYTD